MIESIKIIWHFFKINKEIKKRMRSRRRGERIFIKKGEEGERESRRNLFKI